jgi:hypothetical protein
LFLNSQDKMSGTNANATFKAEILPDMFKTDRLNVRLNNFITSSPSGMSNGIAHIALTGVENPFSYHSSNQNTHQVLHTIRTSPNATILREYPPAALTGDTTTLSNQAYGNGTYTLSSSTGVNATARRVIFDKTSTASATNAWYNGTTGIYSGSVTTLLDGVSRSGDFTQIRTPSPIVLSNFTIQTFSGIQSSCPNTFVFAASTNGNTRTQIASASNLT